MNYLFWLSLNLGVPIFGPIFVLSLVAVSYGRSVARDMIVESVKDGQLFWSAIAVSAASIYELINAFDHASPLVQAKWSLVQFGILIFVGVIVASSVLVMMASIKAHAADQRFVTTTALSWTSSPTHRSNHVLGASIFVIAFSAMLAAFVHSWIT